ncbi:Kinesin, partial [Oryctes borbonicus]
LEIYNEKVNDLLTTAEPESSPTRRASLSNLKVREHPTRGTYVQGLTERRVKDPEALLEWLEVGNTRRRVSATSINSRSSRSHSVVTIKCLGGVKLNLVDLAGSERTGSRTYTTSTFREGANINKSLVALGNVVTALADQTSKYSRGFKKRFVPYRDSVLTWLLKNTLGGNSQTVMIATISSSSICYNETVNTLRFGHRAKQIIAQPLANEDPKQQIIRNLKCQVAKLKELLLCHKIDPSLSENNEESQLSILELEEDIPPSLNVDSVKEQVFVETVDESTNTEEEFFPKTDFIPYLHAIFHDRLKEIFQNKLIDNFEKGSTIIDKINLSNDTENNEKNWGNHQNNLVNGFSVDILNDIKFDTIQYVITKLANKIQVDWSSYSDKKFDLSKINYLENPKKNIWKLDSSKGFDIICQTTERLIPVMDVTTSSNIEKPVVKLRRTYSVCSDMDGRKQKMYGSHETLAGASAAKVEKMRKSQSTTLRKTSLDKSSQSLKNLLLKKDDEKKISTKIEAKVDSIRKNAGKPRAEIVAAVTERLYTKVKKKETATETDEIIKEHKGTMARPRLQDITQRAIRYYKRKHIETQTDANPVMRVKDMSTDVEDLKIDLAVVKDANISTEITENKDMGINCNFLGAFDNIDLNSLKLTSSCGVQVDDSVENKELKAGDKSNNHLISFTKYLRGNENRSLTTTTSSSNPIYTSSVNINVSHNYINGNSSISGDSLDEQNLQNLCFPTPDLLSNHSSLEQPGQELSPAKEKEHLNFAASDDIPVQYNVNEEFESNFGESCNAKYSLVPQLIKQVGVNIPSVYAPEIHLMKKSEKCNLLNNSKPKLCKPNVTQENNNFGASITIQEPQILKSIMKHNNLHCDQQFDSDSESTDISADTFENVPDSLNYHINKRVHFTEERVKDGHMFEAMTNFLKEATNLMSNLSIVANKLDRSSEEGYEMQVTISDVNKVLPSKQRKRYRKKSTSKSPKNVYNVENTYYESTSCQTTPKKTNTRCTETEFPVNKFETSVREACDRLEQCTNRISRRSERTALEESTLHRFPQPFSVTDWNDFSSLQPEDSSLESNPAYSDYGSLPRRKVKHKSFLTPSAYLKQLTNMRKHIIDSAR